MDNNTTAGKVPRLVDLLGDQGLMIIEWILLAITIPAFLYGVTSWCLINKFRHFRNYLVLSAITANMLKSIVTCLSTSFINHKSFILDIPVGLLLVGSSIMFTVLSFNSWVLVLSYLFYKDFVKVFKIDVASSYLKTSIFAWDPRFIVSFVLFPFVWIFDGYEIVLSNQVDHVTYVVILVIPVIVTLVIYLSVLYSFFCINNSDVETSTNKWHCFFLSTLIFVVSNLLYLIHVLDVFNVKNSIVNDMLRLAGYFGRITLNVYIVVSRGNQQMWKEYLEDKFRENKIHM